MRNTKRPLKSAGRVLLGALLCAGIALGLAGTGKPALAADPPAVVWETPGNHSGFEVAKLIRDNVNNNALFVIGSRWGSNSRYAVIRKMNTNGAVLWEKVYGTNLTPDVSYEKEYEGANDIAVDPFGNPWAVITIVEARTFNSVTRNVPIVRLLKLNSANGDTLGSRSTAGWDSLGAIAATTGANAVVGNAGSSLAISKTGDVYLLATSLRGWNDIGPDLLISKNTNSNLTPTWNWIWNWGRSGPQAVTSQGKTLNFSQTSDYAKSIALVGTNEEPVITFRSETIYSDGITYYGRNHTAAARFNGATGDQTRWSHTFPNFSAETNKSEADYWDLWLDDAATDPDGNSYLSAAGALIKLGPNGEWRYWMGLGWPNAMQRIALYADTRRRKETWRVYATSTPSYGDYKNQKVFSFSAETGAHQWTREIPSPNGQPFYAKDLKVDAAGSPIAVFTGGVGSGDQWKGLLAKYTPKGTPIWQFAYNPTGSTFYHASSLALSPAGTIYLAGYNAGSGGWDAITTRFNVDPFAVVDHEVFNIGKNVATVEWVLNRPAPSSYIQWKQVGAANGPGRSISSSSSNYWVTTLDGLLPETSYQYLAGATNPENGQFVFAEGTFTTLRDPILNSLNPVGVERGATDVTLTVKGGFFTTQSKIWFNGTERTTTFVSDSELKTTLTAADTATAGQYSVQVQTAGIGSSETLPFKVYERAATVESVTPDRWPQDYGQEAKMTIRGANFVQGKTIVVVGFLANWGGIFYIDTKEGANAGNVKFISSTEIEVTLPSHAFEVPDRGTPGTGEWVQHRVFVWNPDDNPETRPESPRWYVDPVAPKIKAVTLFDQTPTSLRMRVDTSVRGQLKLEYGKTTGYGTTLQGISDVPDKSKIFDLASLTPGTSYYYRLTLTNPYTGTATYTGSFVTGTAQTAKVTVTGITLARVGGELVASVTLKNTGTATATGINVTSSNLAGVNTLTGLPAPVSDLLPNASTTVSLRFPNRAAGSAMLTVQGSSSGGMFNTTLRVRVP